MVCHFLRFSPSGDSLYAFVLIFYICCPLSGHRWTAILTLTHAFIFRLPTHLLLTTSSIFSKHSIISKSPLSFCKSILSLLIIFSLLLISGDIHPSPCFVSAPVVSNGKHRSVQCSNYSPWVHRSCSGLSLSLTLEKYLQKTPGNAQSARLLLKLPLYPTFSHFQKRALLKVTLPPLPTLVIFLTTLN